MPLRFFASTTSYYAFRKFSQFQFHKSVLYTRERFSSINQSKKFKVEEKIIRKGIAF